LYLVIYFARMLFYQYTICCVVLDLICAVPANAAPLAQQCHSAVVLRLRSSCATPSCHNNLFRA